MQNRAKQFMSFEPLNGFREMLIEKEREIELIGIKELAVDQLDFLDRMIQKLKIGDNIIVVYYNIDDYNKCEGKLKKIDRVNKCIYINNFKINLDVVIDIKKQSIN